MIRSVLYGVIFTALTTFNALAQTLPAPSNWTNLRGSILSIGSIEADGKIHGSYVNNAPNTSCLATAYPLEGHMQRTAITFTVTFAPCNTVTVWRGVINGHVIKTKFKAAYSQNGELKIWKGEDIFNQQ